FMHGSARSRIAAVRVRNTQPLTKRRIPMRRPKNPLILAAILASTFLLGARSAAAQYKQKNLVSNQHGMAIHTDRHLINGWGLAFFPHGPFWVADEGTGV